MSIENQESKSDKKDWVDYEYAMEEFVVNNDPNQLEDLLREDHPLLPGEKEAFDWLKSELKEKLGRDPRVKLDKNGFHVIRAEEEEKDEGKK